MSRQNDTGRPHHTPLRALVLAVACGWLLLVLGAFISVPVIALAAQQPATQTAHIPAYSTQPVAPTNTPVPPTSTPGSQPTATPTGTPSSTPGASPTATATSSGGSGGGGGGGGGNQGGGGGGPAGPNVTRVVFSQPTVGSSDNGPLQGLTPSAFGDNGLLLASTFGCVTALLGVIIAAIALLVLVRGGYGPFLKALLRGKRAGRKRGKQDEAGAAPDWNAGQGGWQGAGMGYPGEAGYAPPMQRGPGYASGFRGDYDDDEYRPPPSRSARPPAPRSRGQQDWR